MELLKERIRKDGVIKEGNVLKVDSFINHQMDIKLMNEIGKEFKRIFSDVQIDKILTIEASGIGIAAIVAQYFDVPMVFAKKAQSINLDGEMLTASVVSFTHKKKYQIIVAKRFISEGENVLIIDDFLANGCAAQGLMEVVESAGAKVQGIGIVIEKGFQDGGKNFRERGIRVESLAIVESMDAENQTIVFRDDK
ncbi:MAG: xanthine phosphoribosyltransferase [Eubacteriales bacterium]|nr:xanthine phosphoribosyltransferase [Eubacteriales bacterium]